MSLALVIGGTRSGKSAHAEQLAAATGLPVRYVATADDADPSMRERIAAHVARRPASWTTVTAGADLAAAVAGRRETCVAARRARTLDRHALHRAGAFEDPSVRVRRAQQVLAEVDRAVAGACRRAGAAIVVAEQAGEGVLPARRRLPRLGRPARRGDAALRGRRRRG